MATANLQVATSARDTYEASGTSTITQANAFLTAGGRYLAAAFQVPAGQGATISSATFGVYIYDTAYDDPIATIKGMAADNVAAFNGTSNEVSSVTPTTASTSWSATGVGTGFKSIDVTSIVQEIVNRGGWAANNWLCLYVYSEAGCNLRARCYDAASSEAPELDVTYTDAAGTPKKTMHYARMR